jgi:hypothetical protein
MKKSRILITFAWTVEAFGVLAGLVTAMVTTFPAFLEGEFNESKWKLLIAIPMAMVAVAELGRIPMTSMLFQRRPVMQIITVVGILFLAGIAFENWLFGFERIVDMRLKPVNEATLQLSRRQDDLKDLEHQREEAVDREKKKREDLRADNDLNETAITAEKNDHLKKLKEIENACLAVPYKCMGPKMDQEAQRHDDTMRPLLKRRDELSREITTSVKIDLKKLDADIGKARTEVSAAKKNRAMLLNQTRSSGSRPCGIASA